MTCLNTISHLKEQDGKLGVIAIILGEDMHLTPGYFYSTMFFEFPSRIWRNVDLLIRFIKRRIER